jgi:hypothetical protein
MDRGPLDYLSYLLRMWRAGKRGAPVWRASLQSPQTGERVSFAKLDDLFAFLREQAGLVPDGEDTSPRESVGRAITRYRRSPYSSSPSETSEGT